MAMALPRSATPPRSAVPIRLLRICLDESVLGSVEVSDGSTLEDVRGTIAADEIPRVPEAYLFLAGGAPVSRRQECQRRAVDCFPFLTIIPENAWVPARGSEDSLGLAPTAEDGEASPPATPTRASHHTTLELQITDGPLEGTTVTVGGEGARIGRHTSNTLVIPEAGISRYHCEIEFRDGEFRVKDLGSTTGTFFYLRAHQNFQMFTGLMVKLGETEFQVLSQSLPGTEVAEQQVLFYEGPLAGHKVQVPLAGLTIGRRHNNALILVQDGTVSAHHAAIFHERGEHFLTDLGSCNGTCIRLSGERQESHWHPIFDGDTLGAGCTKVRCTIHR